ncbi:hypothetical protein LEP1GSC115_0891 [Leptospira interrogans serovar Australis str. 200703203]|uniref:Uncharacterized protein n=1 Tax=Leptospira interrogans serovar Australis str. 200703203 TaxID=1085541 RepID=N1UI93_LEPIR|nr:hypothetical protein LEP1GSC115_0891 [Leptospira interrogans serovar Australis str. 200703203]
MKYIKYLIFFFSGTAAAFFISFWIETMNPEPHEGALLFESFAWCASMYVAGVCGILAGK